MEKEFLPLSLSESLHGKLDGVKFMAYWCRYQAMGSGGGMMPYGEPFLVYQTYAPTVSFHVICGAPLWQQAFDYFREKHNAHYMVDIESAWSGTFKYEILHIAEGEEQGSNLCFTNCKSYKEAQLACLEKLIELVK